MSDGPQIQIDDDWKAQARAEKQRLAGKAAGKAADQAKASQAAAAPVAEPTPSPAASQARSSQQDQSHEAEAPEPADFRMLVSSIASQAMLYLGMLPDPSTGQRIVGLNYARQQLDLLTVLETKTQGNLDDEENHLLASMLHRLRKQYVQVTMQMRPVPDADM